MSDTPPPRPTTQRQTSLTLRMVTVIVSLLIAGLTIAGATILGILQAQLIGQVESEITAAALRLSATNPQSTYTTDTFTLPSNYYVRIEVEGAQTQQWISLIDKKDSGTPAVDNIMQLAPMTDSGVTQPITVASDTDVKWQAVAAPIYQHNVQIGLVTVAQPLTPVQNTIHNTAVYLLICGIILTIVGGVSAFYMVRYSLRPLREIEAVAGRIAEGDLSQRIVDEPPGTEVGSLARSLNKMLSRIERSFALQKHSEEKMRRFIADASHELRTPLAAIRGYGELYEMGGVPSERVPDVMHRISSEAARMGILVEDLLKLVRLDEGRQHKVEPVNLADLVRNSAMDLIALSPGRDVTLWGLNGKDFPEELWTAADTDQVTQVMMNLIGNIDRYTPSDSPVEILVGTYRSSPSAELMDVIEVRDHGPGVNLEALPRLFERFYRADTSRSRETGGTGLGLSIVDAVAKAHQGIAQAMETPGGGLTVRFSLKHHSVTPSNNSGFPAERPHMPHTSQTHHIVKSHRHEEPQREEAMGRFRRLFRSEKDKN
ncbi:MAG: HAMP domain-containing sensor histidine kinase [Actinomycetaceae bacterium]|nr:HAMP domain-containing sensor histidine kinase [Actinomycetaceae bacterium]MDO5747019.1 HAMP domain-containing sensor histidine kinase [Actinomycetaceae bacterium]